MLADGFPLRFEWQQISTNLQDTSQYSVRSQKCYSLDGFHSSFYFQVLQSCTNYLVTVLSALIANYITVIFMFHSFLSSLVKSMYLSLFLLWLSFTLWSAWTTKVTVFQFLYLLFFFIVITGSGHLTVIKGSVCNSKSQRIFCILFSKRTDYNYYHHHLHFP